jgi:hypothetical protein
MNKMTVGEHNKNQNENVPPRMGEIITIIKPKQKNN